MRPKDKSAIARRHLDERLNQVSFSNLSPPPRGWIRAIREALGMSAAQLGRRIGISQPSVVELEESEATDRIKLSTLRRAAAALNCKLVYAIVPDDPLEMMVQNRSKHLAEADLSRVERTMALENQTVTDPDARQRDLEALLAQINIRKLWDDR